MSTSGFRLSNNSSELKVEVRTSSSLSNDDDWEGNSDQNSGSGGGSAGTGSAIPHHVVHPKTHLSVATADYVDGRHLITAGTLPPYNKSDAPVRQNE